MERKRLIYFDEMTKMKDATITINKTSAVGKSETSENSIVTLVNNTGILMSELTILAATCNSTTDEMVQRINNMLRGTNDFGSRLAEMAKSLNDMYKMIGPLPSHKDGHPGKTYFEKKNRRVNKYR